MQPGRSTVALAGYVNLRQEFPALLGVIEEFGFDDGVERASDTGEASC